jgi:hypothetical protein
VVALAAAVAGRRVLRGLRRRRGAVERRRVIAQRRGGLLAAPQLQRLELLLEIKVLRLQQRLLRLLRRRLGAPPRALRGGAALPLGEAARRGQARAEAVKGGAAQQGGLEESEVVLQGGG